MRLQEEVEIKQLLPLKRADFAAMHIPVDAPREELALVPSAEAVMDRIVPDYLVGFVYGALVEAFSCEQNARMMAMENATNSAKDMLHELDILYNRARQAAITQEITEVIARVQRHRNAKRRDRKINWEAEMNTGKIVQVSGPVVDVEFENVTCRQSEMLGSNEWR